MKKKVARTPEQKAARRAYRVRNRDAILKRAAELRRIKNPKIAEREKLNPLQKKMLKSAMCRDYYTRNRERILARKRAAYAVDPAPQIARVYAARADERKSP